MVNYNFIFYVSFCQGLFQANETSPVLLASKHKSHKTARRSKTVLNFAKRILTILDNVGMNMQRDCEVKQQLSQNNYKT